MDYVLRSGIFQCLISNSNISRFISSSQKTDMYIPRLLNFIVYFDSIAIPSNSNFQIVFTFAQLVGKFTQWM